MCRFPPALGNYGGAPFPQRVLRGIPPATPPVKYFQTFHSTCIVLIGIAIIVYGRWLKFSRFFLYQTRFKGFMDNSKIETEVAKVLDPSGFELVDLKMASHNGKPLLQVFVDREQGGVLLDDCTALSEKIGECLDANNFYENGYFLEVSSPGVDRVVKKEKDFKRFAGRQVKVRLKRPVNGSRVYYGTISGFENGQVLLSGDLKFSLEDIDEARLNPTDDEILKGK